MVFLCEALHWKWLITAIIEYVWGNVYKNGDVPLAKLNYQRLLYLIGIGVHDMFLGLSLLNGIREGCRQIIHHLLCEFAVLTCHPQNQWLHVCSFKQWLQTPLSPQFLANICQHNNEFAVVLTAPKLPGYCGFNHVEKWWKMMEFVNGKDCPIYEMENKINVWNHQPVIIKPPFFLIPLRVHRHK